MKAITQNLNKELKSKLKTADELWVAVALITNKGLEFIQDNVPKQAKQNYILGIDLPTDIIALKRLNKQQSLGNNVKVQMYAKQEFFHPKVYILKSKKTYTAYVGSANCTYNGLHKNIELSFIIEEQKACKELLKWYFEIQKKGSILSDAFIFNYSSSYKSRLERKRKDESQAKKDKKQIEQIHLILMHRRNELIKRLKRYRNHKDYGKDKNERFSDIKELKQSLDYPLFNNINIDAFFENWALGHLIYIPKPTLKEKKKEFKKMLKFLTDDSIDVAIRLNRALNGDLYIRGVGVATITKILTLHNPKKYCVMNDMIKTVLNEYGIEMPMKISQGEKYKATNKFLIEICEETGIDDLGILDYYLYKESCE